MTPPPSLKEHVIVRQHLRDGRYRVFMIEVVTVSEWQAELYGALPETPEGELEGVTVEGATKEEALAALKQW